MAKIASRENSVRKQTKRGIFERQEQSNDIPKVGQYEICIPQP